MLKIEFLRKKKGATGGDAVGQEEDTQSRRLVRGSWADAGGEEGGEAEVPDWWRQLQDKCAGKSRS